MTKLQDTYYFFSEIYFHTVLNFPTNVISSSDELYLRFYPVLYFIPVFYSKTQCCQKLILNST